MTLSPPAPAIWRHVVGQAPAIRALSEAACDAAGKHDGFSGAAMTHAWVITGPPGSGRSHAALAFAAALQCAEQGCGTCGDCSMVLRGIHPDVLHFEPAGLFIRMEDIRDELLPRSEMTPMLGGWNVLIVQDADRLNEFAGNALLKSLEEPTPRTVWVLCAPSIEDLLPTIASRVRHVGLTTPAIGDVAAHLVAHVQVEPALAAFAARAAQGHIGRARALATSEEVRIRRGEVLRIPSQLRDLPSCFAAAGNVLETATADAAALTNPQDEAELAELRRVFGEPTGRGAAGAKRSLSAMTSDLERRQKVRRTRAVRDQLDRALLDLIGFYRDVLSLQVGASSDLINAEMRPSLEALAAHSDVAMTLGRCEALSEARLALAAAVAPLLALEALMVRLTAP